MDGPKNSNGDDPVLPSTGITGWTVTMISKNCKDPGRAIKFMDYLMSEHGQKLLYLGVEGVTYTEEDGKIEIVPEVKELLNRDREEYDEKYAADDTYWMLQNNVMQLQWKLEPEEPLKQLAEWTYPYTTYLGQYEFIMSQNTEAGVISDKVDKLWGETIRDLLLASSDEEFDEIVEAYKKERNALGFTKVVAEKSRQIRENKKKLGME